MVGDCGEGCGESSGGCESPLYRHFFTVRWEDLPKRNSHILLLPGEDVWNDVAFMYLFVNKLCSVKYICMYCNYVCTLIYALLSYYFALFVVFVMLLLNLRL